MYNNPRYRTAPCFKHNVFGYCPYGDQCHFIHDNRTINLEECLEKLALTQSSDEEETVTKNFAEDKDPPKQLGSETNSSTPLSDYDLTETSKNDFIPYSVPKNLTREPKHFDLTKNTFKMRPSDYNFTEIPTSDFIPYYNFNSEEEPKSECLKTSDLAIRPYNDQTTAFPHYEYR